MGIHRADRPATVTPRFIAALILLLLSTVLSGKDIKFTFEMQDNPAGERERIYFIILVDHAKTGEVEVAMPKLPSGVVLTHGPYKSLYADEDSANVPAKTRVMYYVRGDRTGRYIIDPFIITVGEVSFKTEPEILEIGNYKNRELYIPIEIAWVISKKEVYVGQSVPVTLQLLNQREISLIESYTVTPPRGAFFEEIPDFGDIETIKVGSKFLYNIPVSSYMFTPSQSGRLFIPAAEVSALGQETESTTVRVDVKALPAEVRTTGAVGTFSYFSEVDSARLDAGSLGTLSVRVEGEGNIDYLNLPTPDFGDLVQTDRNESLEIRPSEGGYAGWRLVEYSYLSDKAGSHLISIPPLIYFDPAAGEIKRAEGNTFRITYAADYQEPESAEETIPFSMLQADEISSPGLKNAYSDPLSYLWLLPAPLAFVILLVLKRTKLLFVSVVWMLLGAGGSVPNTCEDVTAGIQAYEEGDYQGALDGFLRCAGTTEGTPGLYYALSLTELYAGSHHDAMYFIRRAIRMDPHRRVFWEYYYWLHDYLELERPVDPAGRMHPDIFLYSMLGLFSLGFLARTLYLLKRSGMYIVVFLLCMVLSIGAGGGLLITALQFGRSTAIVYQHEARVRKIPSMTASEWISFPASQSVRVLDESHEFYLVETAFGLKGWVEKNNILIDKR